MSSTTRRVAITGMGTVTPLGHNYSTTLEGLYGLRSGVVSHSPWQEQGGLATKVAAPVGDIDVSSIPRKKRRSMSRVSQLATLATEEALTMSGLDEDLVRSARTGISYGSTMGGTSSVESYFRSIAESRSFVDGVSSTTFLQIMSHTCAANLALTFEIPGRVVASCTACAAGLQAIGFGYESIKIGVADRMICGGAEELHISVSAVFDTMRATSTAYNDAPNTTPRPFGKDRDGIVVGEGAATVVLEAMDLAVARGATIYGEVEGYCTNTDSNHMTNPSVEGMEAVMCGALESAGVAPDQVDYVNAHGTGTPVGDVAESHAINHIFGASMAVSSLKGHFGHLMGACGAVEAAACLAMIDQGRLIPTLNLGEVDDMCAPLDYVKEKVRIAPVHRVLKNSFAFGGINASLVLAKVPR